jgi:hypothetical protein
MTDAVIFGFGCLVTLMCAAAIASLMRAAYLDGQYQREQAQRSGKFGAKSEIALGSGDERAT